MLRALWDAPVSRCVRLLPAIAPLASVGLVGLLVLAAAMPAAAIVTMGLMIGSLPATVQAGAASPAAHHTLYALIAWAAAMLASQIVTRPLWALAGSARSRIDAHLQERVMIALNQPWSIAHLEDQKTADLVSQVAGVGVSGFTPGGAIFQLITSRALRTLTALISGALLFAYHWWAPVLLLGAQLAFSAVNQRIAARQAATVLGQTRALRRADYYRDLALAPSAAKEVRLLDIADWIAGRVRGEWLGSVGQQWRTQRRDLVVSVAAAAGAALVNLIVFGLIGFDAARGLVSLSAALIFLRAAQAFTAIGQLGAADFVIEHGAASLPSLLALERLAGPIEAPGAKPPPADAPAVDIRFEGVGFAYPGGAPVLRDLNLTIPAGSSMALVGLNGAGKTTVVKLLARLYDPTEGVIRVDGVDLRDIAPSAWRARIAAIFQDFLRYHLNARDNIGFGGLARAGDQAALEQAATKAGVLDRIAALPKGWDTPLARQYTGGADLSGGEWQRIALARALFAVEAGAKVLILDEPTSNLDVRGEAEIYDRFLDLTRGLTTVLISHRFSTVRRADRICVLEDGAVSEIGSHDELMARGGRYAELFTLQSARFTDDDAESAA
jgi:ATP-binding cassette, subfamily B, bacterial